QVLFIFKYRLLPGQIRGFDDKHCAASKHRLEHTAREALEERGERDDADKLRKISKIFVPQAPAYSEQLLSQGAQLFRAGLSVAACRHCRGHEAFELINERRRMLEPLVGIEQSAADKLPIN